MRTIEISKSRLKELEKLETKIHALEGAGVDNWEGYSIAMEQIEAREVIDYEIENAVKKALIILQESAFEPSERGAGFAATEDAEEKAFNILVKCLNKLE